MDSIHDLAGNYGSNLVAGYNRQFDETDDLVTLPSAPLESKQVGTVIALLLLAPVVLPVLATLLPALAPALTALASAIAGLG